MLSFPNKDPDEVLDYVLDWSLRLGSDSIITSSWVVDNPGLVINSNSYVPTNTTIWLSAGVVNVSYLLTNHVVTQGGRTMEQSVKIKIKEK